MSFPEILSSLFEPWQLFLSEDPLTLLVQSSLILLGAVVIFLVFYATRDILLRTNSFLYMFICIVLVAVLPIIGFMLYLLIRPTQTLREREVYELVQTLKKKERKPVAKAKPAKATKKSTRSRKKS